MLRGVLARLGPDWRVIRRIRFAPRPGRAKPRRFLVVEARSPRARQPSTEPRASGRQVRDIPGSSTRSVREAAAALKAAGRPVAPFFLPPLRPTRSRAELAALAALPDRPRPRRRARRRDAGRTRLRARRRPGPRARPLRRAAVPARRARPTSTRGWSRARTASTRATARTSSWRPRTAPRTSTSGPIRRLNLPPPRRPRRADTPGDHCAARRCTGSAGRRSARTATSWTATATARDGIADPRRRVRAADRRPLRAAADGDGRPVLAAGHASDARAARHRARSCPVQSRTGEGAASTKAASAAGWSCSTCRPRCWRRAA